MEQALSKVNPNQQSTQGLAISKASSSDLQKRVALTNQLSKLAIRRQAKLSHQDFEVFVEDLMGFEMRDIESAMVSLSSRPRAEGETSFPEAAVIVAEVTKAGRSRRIAEDRERRKSDEAREAARRRNHPEEYEGFTVKDFENLSEKFGDKFKFDRPKPKAAAELTHCPHCHTVLPIASNIRLWTPQEMREMASVMEVISHQADLNREANKAWQDKCVAEQLANLPSTPIPAICDEVEA